MSILLLFFLVCHLNLVGCGESTLENFEKPCKISRIVVAKNKNDFWAKITLELQERVYDIESMNATRCKYSDRENTKKCMQKFKDVKKKGDILSCLVKYDTKSKTATKDSNFKILFVEEKKKPDTLLNRDGGKTELPSTPTPEKEREKERESGTIKSDDIPIKSYVADKTEPSTPTPEKKEKKRKKGKKKEKEKESGSAIPTLVIIVTSIGLVVVGTLFIVKKKGMKKEVKPVISRAITAKKLPIEDNPRETTRSIIEEIGKIEIYRSSDDERWNQYVEDVIMAQFACKKLDEFFPKTPYALTYGTLSPLRKAPDRPNILLLWNGRPKEYNPSGSTNNPSKQEFLGVRFHFQGGSSNGSVPFNVLKEEMMLTRITKRFLERRGVKALGYRSFKTKVFFVGHFDGQDNHLGSNEYEVFRKIRLGVRHNIEGDINDDDEEEETSGFRADDDDYDEEEEGGGEFFFQHKFGEVGGEQSVSERDIAETRDLKSLKLFQRNIKKLNLLEEDEDVKFANFVLEHRKEVFKGYPYLFDSRVFEKDEVRKRTRISFVFGNAEGDWLVVVVRKFCAEGEDREKLMKESESIVPNASDSISGMGRKITRLRHAAVTVSDLDQSLQSTFQQKKKK